MVPAHRRSRPVAHRSLPTTISNRLLAALPAAEYLRIAPTLEIVPMTLKEVLQRPGDPVRWVYFPGGGFCSVVTVLNDGSMVEVTTIGREGMVGSSAVLEGHAASFAVLVQGASEICYRMAAPALREAMERRGAFYDLLSRYAQALVGCIMQSTACNAVHSAEQRLARWLLLAHDRMGKDVFPLTQEFVAMMLGVTRPTVSVIAGTLQKAGLITYHRGQVAVVDRERLENAACECYRAATTLLTAVTDGAQARKT